MRQLGVRDVLSAPSLVSGGSWRTIDAIIGTTAAAALPVVMDQLLLLQLLLMVLLRLLMLLLLELNLDADFAVANAATVGVVAAALTLAHAAFAPLPPPYSWSLISFSSPTHFPNVD